MRCAAALAAAAVAACDGSEPTRVKMDFARPTGLYDAPFPADDLRAGDTIDLSRFPNPEDAEIVEQVRALLVGVRGFATSGGVFFPLTGPIDPATLPDLAASVSADAPVFLVGIEPGAADHGRRYPVEVSYEAHGGLYAVPDMLALVPLQGVPLRPSSRYAAVVTTAVTDAAGAPLAPATAAELSELTDVVTALAELGVEPGRIAGVTAFSTGDPTAELSLVRDAALARPLPAPHQPFARTDLFDDFCVYQSTLSVPDYQAGEPPYRTAGGQWTFDAGGAPILQREADARVVITVPRAPMPPAGYPLVVFVRTGGGGDRPLVDRGRRLEPGGEAAEPGEGPARYIARAGFAALQFDGPLGGLRNPTGGDEQFLMFNIQNLGALRDNVRQSAVELAVIAHVAEALRLDASDCPPAGEGGPGPGEVWFDPARFALMGHSMGATIAPLAAALEPRYGALVLSGAGGSWIENIVYKRKPLEVAAVIGLLLRQGSDVRTNDPVLTLAQWALEPADPQVYAEALVRAPAPGAAPRHVLMVQGIVDEYILPRIANATSLSFGLDLAGPALDASGDPRLDGQTPLEPLLPLVGRAAIDLPASVNVELDGGRRATAVVVQHLEDGLEDGHEVLFQTDAPKHQYQCFLHSWLRGDPTVWPGADRDAPCP